MSKGILSKRCTSDLPLGGVLCCCPTTLPPWCVTSSPQPWLLLPSKSPHTNNKTALEEQCEIHTGGQRQLRIRNALKYLELMSSETALC